MVVSEIKMYEILKSKFGQQEAETIIEGIAARVDTKFEDKKDLFATKQDTTRIEQKILETEIRLLTKLNNQFYWTIGISITALAIAVAIIKM